MVHSTKTFRHRTKTRLIKAYKALYYGCFGCAPALRWKRYLPGNFTTQVIFAKINGKCLAYHSIPKVGSTTVKSLLLDAIGHPVPASSISTHLTVRHFRHNPHLPWRQPASSDNYLILFGGNCPLPPPNVLPEFDRAFHFAFVRNPWARLVSCYANKVLAMLPRRFADFRRSYPRIRFERMAFTDFVRFVCRVPDDLCDSHFVPQYRLLDLSRSTIDFVGRVERFATDLTEVIRLAGLDKRLLKWAHTKRMRSSPPPQGRLRSDTVHYTDFYTTQTRNLVARKYARDIDRFGYRFGD